MKIERTILSHRAAIIQSAPVFGGLTGPGLTALAEVSGVRSYEAGEYIFMQGDAAEGFYVVVAGAVKVMRSGVDGREQILHVFDCRGDPVGEVAVFQGGTYPASAVANTDSDMLYIPRHAFVEASRRHPEITLKMLATLSQRLRRFVELIDDLSLKDVATRLARHLLELSEKIGSDEIELETTKVVLASKLGTIAETLSRTLRKMQNRGIINVEGRRIRIVDEDALDDIAEGGKL